MGATAQAGAKRARAMACFIPALIVTLHQAVRLCKRRAAYWHLTTAIEFRYAQKRLDLRPTAMPKPTQQSEGPPGPQRCAPPSPAGAQPDGPFLFMRHPNCTIVTAEILVFPMMFGSYAYGIAFVLTDADILPFVSRPKTKGWQARAAPSTELSCKA